MKYKRIYHKQYNEHETPVRIKRMIDQWNIEIYEYYKQYYGVTGESVEALEREINQ